MNLFNFVYLKFLTLPPTCSKILTIARSVVQCKWGTVLLRLFLSFRLNTARSNEILGWEGVGNRQLLCFFKA
jgi:hypothetical protein